VPPTGIPSPLRRRMMRDAGVPPSTSARRTWSPPVKNTPSQRTSSSSTSARSLSTRVRKSSTGASPAPCRRKASAYSAPVRGRRDATGMTATRAPGPPQRARKRVKIAGSRRAPPMGTSQPRGGAGLAGGAADDAGS
jgi:hypothetical protein